MAHFPLVSLVYAVLQRGNVPVDGSGLVALLNLLALVSLNETYREVPQLKRAESISQLKQKALLAPVASLPLTPLPVFVGKFVEGDITDNLDGFNVPISV